METNTLWASVIGGITVWIVYLIGGVDELIRALTILMAIDLTLGVMVAWLIKDVDSRKAFKGLLKDSNDINGRSSSAIGQCYRQWRFYA